jgi:hypothetical protein
MITTPYDKILKKRIRIAVTVLALTAIYLFAGMYWLVMTGFGWMLYVFFRDAYYAFFCKKRPLSDTEIRELNKFTSEVDIVKKTDLSDSWVHGSPSEEISSFNENYH